MVSRLVKRRRYDYGRSTETANPGKFQPLRKGRKLGWVRSNFSCKSLLGIRQPDLDPRIKRRFVVENSVICIQKYIIQTLKRQRPHISNKNPSILNIGSEQCIAAFIVAVYFFYSCKKSHKPARFEWPRGQSTHVQIQ